jgi:hypothetical protein
MKVKAFVGVLFLAGILASFALGSTSATREGTTSTSTTTTAKPPKCHGVDLRGDATGGSVTLTVAHANKAGHSLVGTAVTLTIPAGAHVRAHACTTDGTTLTLKGLEIKVPKPHHAPGPAKPKPAKPGH